MMSKNFFRLFAALLMTMGVLSIQAQTAVHPKAYYDAITYQWTDATGVTHENAITDEATNPYQIIALLKKIYCDPNIPGPKYSAYDQNGNREREVYYGPVGGGWNISADDVTPPYEDGYTILMVAVSDNLSLYGGDTPQGSGWNNTYSSNFFTQPSELLNYISNNVVGVQLLTDGLRIGEGEAAGTAFNISGTYDRFFMIGKGQARQKDSDVTDYENQHNVIAGERVPFKEMFEQFSPTDGKEGSEITDFYAAMVGGELYGVIHDCASVIEVEHYFSMAGKNNHEPRSLTGLNIFIPDYRLKYWETTYTYNNGWYNTDYTVDGRTLNPYKSTSGYEFRTAPYLCANYGDYNPNIPPKVGIYTIKLEGEAVPTSEDKVYNVVLDWTSSLDEMSGGTVGQDFILYIVVKDENGVDNVEEILTTTETSYTYPVPQNEHSYTLTYVVYGQPNDGEHDMFVAWSNEADVVIPGWNDFLSLSLNHVESDYKVNQELNYYRNFLNVGNEDAVNALTPARVNAGENSFTLYRFDAAYPTVLTPVANLTLTANIYRAHYDISYMNQEPLPGFNFNIKTSGSLTLGDNDAIDMGDILFVDQFTASTALNDHPSQYGYVLKLNNADTDKGTNTVDVYVYKTAAKLGGFYTEEEVLDDTEPALTPGVINANVGMNLNGNINVYYYTMQRGYNSLPNVEIMDLQHNTNNTYIETCDDLGMEGTVYAVGPMDILDTDVITGEGDAYMSYLPVIWTFGDDRVDRAQNPLIDNSYGSQIMKTGVTDLDVVVTGTRSDNKFSNWKDENDETCSIYNPVITVTAELPTEASIEYEPYMVRVWRDCDQIRNSVIIENGHRANDWWSPRPAHLLIVEELTDETEFTLGSLATNALAFGATNSANISFVVRYYYKAVNPAKADADAPMYYVVEKTIEWTDITTSINEINASVEVSKTYYNAQGVQSDKPFDGVNIVVTTYSDGSTRTAKVVR